MRQIVLGLDLQGGAYMLMEVDNASVIKSQVEALRDDVRQKLREGRIAISGGIAVQPRGVRGPHRRPGRARQGARASAVAEPADRRRAGGWKRAARST